MMIRAMVAAAMAASAMLLGSGLSAQQEPPVSSRSIEQLDRECDAKQTESCNEMHLRFKFGRGVEASPFRAAYYQLQTCKTGTARACGVYAAYISRNTKGYPPYTPGIDAEYALMGCKGNDVPSCGLALAIANNRKEYDAAQRKVIYDQACRIGTPRDCELASYGESKRSNWQSAAAYAKQACERGQTNACPNVRAYTVRYENSLRPPSPPRQAARQPTYQQQQSMYQNTPAPSSSSNSGARSGMEGCTKTNGGQGQRYWYYGFDNRRKTGPCF